MLIANTKQSHVRRGVRALTAALAALVVGAAAAQAETAAAEKARAVFDTHCARCHQAGRLENPPAKGALGNILDIERLTERNDLVEPSDPDASRLYQILLARHRPHSVFFGPVPGPAPAEIGLVRDWLKSLPPRRAGCPGRTPVSDADLMRDIAAWRRAFETDAASPLRFVSLANLYNLCRSDATLAAYRDAVTALVNRLTVRKAAALETVGDANVLLAFRPSDAGLTAEAWDLRAGGGDAIKGVVAAEVLAARALAAMPLAPPAGSTIPISQAVAAPAPQDLVNGLDPVEALAHEYTRNVGIARAAIEMSLDENALREKLGALTGDDRILALRLAQTGLPRSEWDELASKLTGTRRRDSTPRGMPDAAQALSVSLWTNALTYKTGDLLTVQARTSEDCNLTIIAVEADGLATVLFPNDTETGNRVSAGALVQIPAEGAPFQLRLDRPGRHTIVAVCNATAKRPQGIGHDFERQRFTVLGDWPTFLLTAADREAEYQKTQDDLRRFRTGAGTAETLEEQLPLGAEDEARAGLSILVE